MVHLEVKPKSGAPWWLWLLLAFIALGLVLFFLNRSTSGARLNESAPDTSLNSTASQGDTLATTGPNNYKCIERYAILTIS